MLLLLLSPAKALDFESPLPALELGVPAFAAEAAELVQTLRACAPQQIADLMDLSDALAALNAARFQAWQPHTAAQPIPAQARPALLAFNGDVYQGLDAHSLTRADLDWAQQHLCILSGLYGVLRPLDALQAYRLEMGTRLATARGRNLYHFWGQRISAYLNQRAAEHAQPLIVNLASEEYFKAVDPRALQVPVLTCVFEQWHRGGYRVLGLPAKRARGLMARFAIEQRAACAQQLMGFAAQGYRYQPELSQPQRLVFRQPPGQAA